MAQNTKLIVQRVEELAWPILLSEGLELVDVTYRHEGGRWVLALFIDKPGGVTIADCVAFSREFSDVLDVNDIISDRYSLEVSSPGINRPLKRIDDFNRFKGENVRIKVNPPVDGRKNFRGLLLGYSDGTVKIEENAIIFDIAYNTIDKAVLDKNIEQKGSLI